MSDLKLPKGMSIKYPVVVSAGRTIEDANGQEVLVCHFNSGPGKALTHVQADEMTDAIAGAINRYLVDLHNEEMR